MGSKMLALMLFAAVVCAAQGLRCHHCVNVTHDNPNTPVVEERECGMFYNKCIKIIMHSPAYGEVRRCATEKQCEEKALSLVEKHCCDTDLCN